MTVEDTRDRPSAFEPAFDGVPTAAAPVVDAAVEQLRRRLEQDPGTRIILGIAGAPGSGKSTLAQCLVRALGPDQAIVVPMDGFHLAEAVIAGTPLKERKGAPDTFDVGGYVALLRRLRARDEQVVYAPEYRRGLEEPIAAAISVPRDLPLVITEGNYLLLDDEPWPQAAAEVDETWFVRSEEPVRLMRLVERHVAFGMSRERARAWAMGSDQANAQLVEQTMPRADRVIEWP